MSEGEVSTSDRLPENSIVIRRDQALNRGPGIQVRALAVVDGDTFVAREGERLYLLKLRDVEAPELEQAFGLEARRLLVDRVVGQRVKIWPEKAEGCVVPVRAETLEGTNISEQLTSKGLAWASRPAPEKLRRLESAARLGRVGLWQESAPEPPWEYRARRRMARKP